MLSRFQQFLLTHELIIPGKPALLAVSGGIDSVCMCHLFARSGIEFGVAHCNFGLRRLESDGDEYFVQELAHNLGARFFSRHFETLDYAAQQGISVQMAARELRYSYFEDLARQCGFGVIATAHHADDAIETFFINLMRGTGISGLQGIPLKNGKLIRPLLFAGRQDIENYVKDNRLRFREDSSNDEDHYLRNRIRQQLIPAFCEISPHFKTAMKGNLGRLQEAGLALKALTDQALNECVLTEAGRITISMQVLRKYKPLPYFLHSILKEYGFHEDVIDQLLANLAKQSGKYYQSAHYRLLHDREKLIITPLKKERKSQAGVTIGPSQKEISTPLALRIENVERTDSFTIPHDPNTACIDRDTIEFPLILRRWKAGDVFHPLGARGKKKLSDFFTDHKFSRIDKENCWLLCSGDQVVWVVGHRLAHPFRVTAKTKHLIILYLSQSLI
jgi:tRNA(Ile)-lysidine synthase